MNNIKIYMDNCCFNRPYDDQNILSIYLETQAKLVIQELVTDKKIDLIWSFILDFENGAHPDGAIKKEIAYWKTLSSKMIHKNESIIKIAKVFVKKGLGKKDALHISSAIDGKADFFITVDKGIVKKRTSINEIKIFTPGEYINLMEDIDEN